MRHAKIKFSEVRVPLFTAEGDRLLGELSPSAKVPVLYSDGLVLWDSLAICEYVADRFPDQNLRPENPAALAHARAISAEIHSGFQAMRDAMPMNCRKRYPEFKPSSQVQADITRLKSVMTDALNQFSHSAGWLHGEYSISDAMFAPVVSRFHSYHIPCEGVLKAYCQQVLSDKPMREWYGDSERETEIIQRSELIPPSH